VTNIADEIFNILKGSNYKVRLFTSEGIKTLNPEEATRFYAYDQDLMITLRQDEAKNEIVVQAGAGYDIPGNKKLLDSVKSVAHKNLGEYTVRKFDKEIAPKDFAHQSVKEGTIQEGFSKPFGSMKTSYIQSPNAKLVIKHKQGIDEERRGARSRNIQALFIENSQGERFSFPHRYMAGAKAMAMHVNEGGTPYDDKGTAILGLCEEIAELNKFVRHVKSNNLVNEDNSDIVETISNRLGEYKNTVKSLSTLRGYNNFQVQENKEEINEVDVTEKFLYNTFKTEELNSILSKVGRIVAENTRKEKETKAVIKRVVDIINSGADLKITYSEDDPEHPDNENPKKYSGQSGEMAKMASLLSFLGQRSKNDDLWNAITDLTGDGNHINSFSSRVVKKITDYLAAKAQATPAVESAIGLDEEAILELRKNLS